MTHSVCLRLRGGAALPVILALAGLLSCCSTEQCSVEKLPNHGHSVSIADLASIVQVAAKNDCDDVIYNRMSRRTRDEHFQISVLHVLRKPINDLLTGAGWPAVPTLGETSTMDVLRDGKFINSVPVVGFGDREMMLFGYPAATGEHIFQAFVKLEPDSETRLPEWFLAVEEQIRSDVPPIPGLPPKTPPPDDRPGGKPK